MIQYCEISRTHPFQPGVLDPTINLQLMQCWHNVVRRIRSPRGGEHQREREVSAKQFAVIPHFLRCHDGPERILASIRHFVLHAAQHAGQISTQQTGNVANATAETF